MEQCARQDAEARSPSPASGAARHGARLAQPALRAPTRRGARCSRAQDEDEAAMGEAEEQAAGRPASRVVVEYSADVEDEDEEMRAFLPMSFGKVQQPKDMSLEKKRAARATSLKPASSQATGCSTALRLAAKSWPDSWCASCSPIATHG